MPATVSESRRAGCRMSIAVFALLLWGAPPTWPAAPRSTGPPSIGQPAPALIARSFDGKAIDLAALRGRLVVLNFWASWCGPCRTEMPALDALARDYRERGVIVVGLSADDRHDRRDALAAASGLGYLTGMLAEASTNGFGDPQVLPLTYLIGPDGNIAEILAANHGPLSAAQLRAAVDARLPRAASPGADAGH